MKQLVECVPNFSEGRDKSIIDGITRSISAITGITLLDIDPGRETNRTVVTFAGEPEQILEAAFRGMKAAAELIDMRNHTGAHPRMGATDVCPIIPVSNITVEECVSLAEKLGDRVGRELGIPVYLYGHAARTPERIKLPDIRSGEYEALENKHKNDSLFIPDYGPKKFNPVSGATVIGVRDFLLAYNINLNTTDPRFARDIALSIRETGRAKRDKKGIIIRKTDGSPIKVPGRLKHCQAAGWYIDEYGYAQVTMNLTEYRSTGLHDAFDTVCEEADRLGLRVTGSEVVGLLPKKAVLDAGKYYLEKAGKNTGVPEPEIVHSAVLSLGLNDTVPFKAQDKIVEYALSESSGKLSTGSVLEFVNELSSSSPAPGGGSVSALSGALSAGLSSMVANLTYGKKGYERRYNGMKEISLNAQSVKDRCLQLIDEDTDSFNGYLAAIRLPRGTSASLQYRKDSISAAVKQMIQTPMEVLRLCPSLMDMAEKVLKTGNPSAASDAAVAAVQGESAALGAWFNVKINFSALDDEVFKKIIRIEADEILKKIKYARRRIEAAAVKKVSSGE